MSVAVGVAAVDGLAIATDSRTIQQRADHYRVLSDSAEKLFILENRFVVATYGLATIGDKTIRGHMEDFAVHAPSSIDQCAEALGEFFHARLSEATPARRRDLTIYDINFPLGFLLGGYDEGGIGRFFDVKVRATARPDIKDTGVSTRNPGHAPRGQVDAIERMLHGVDWSAVEAGRISMDDQTRQRLEDCITTSSFRPPSTMLPSSRASWFRLRSACKRDMTGRWQSRRSCRGQAERFVLPH